MNAANGFIFQLYGEAQNRSISEFNDYALHELKKLVSFDSAVLAGGSIESASSYSINSLHLHNQPIEKYTDRKDWEGDQPDPMLIRAYKNKNKTATAELKSMPEMNVEMLKYAKKYDISQSLTFCTSGKNKNDINAIALWRADDDLFTANESFISDFILPHVIQAQEINRRHQALKLKIDNLDSIFLISGLDCKLLHVDEAAIAMLQSEWPEWHPPLLPKDLVEKLSSNKKMLFKGKRISIQAELHEFFLCIKINKLCLDTNLTIRELECLKMVRLGKTSWEIAELLNISERTTNFHITNATHKLGADSRRHAVSKALSLGLLLPG